MRAGFVFLDEAVPGTFTDAKYFSEDNFTGQQVDGYRVNRVAGTVQMALALANAAAAVRRHGLALLLWDGYRPQRAVAFFVKWAALPEDGKTKAAHYPNLDKSELFPLGYICEKSSHSRGSTIDLCLCDPVSGTPIDMGGGFDLMDEASHHGAKGISPAATHNRALLRCIMEAHGFTAYEQEWWHYTLKDEPYPETYFDFEIA